MSQRETIAIPVAGICNLHIGHLSTADAHFTLIRQRLERAGIGVASAAVPHGLGLLHSLEETYKGIEAQILYTASHYPDHDFVLIGHSLGGLLGREFLGRKQFKDQRFVGMVALGSPFGPLKHYSGIWGAAHKADDINRFNARGAYIVPTAEGGPRITHIATTADVVVPPESALTPVPHATPDLHLFTSPLELWRAHGTTDVSVHHYPGPLDHNVMLVAPTIDFFGTHIESPADVASRAVLDITQQPVIAHDISVTEQLLEQLYATP